MLQSKAFQATVWLLLLFLVILVGQQVSFVFHPLVVLIKTIFFPVLVAGILYYLTSSIVDKLTELRIPRTLAILLIFTVFGLIIVITVLYLAPRLEAQLTSLFTNLPRFLRSLDRQLQEFQESTMFSEFERFEFFRKWSNIDYVTVVDTILDSVLQNIISFLGSVANFAVAVFTVPFLLFYMLRDGKKWSKGLIRFLPERYQDDLAELLRDINDSIRSYIQGQLLVCLFIGVMVYIGYLILGLDYALLLAAVAMVMDIIPYFGPLLGTIPGVIVGLIVSPWKALQVIIMVLIVQQIESQLVSPLVLGKKLNIHPVTIIICLLTAGSLGGIFGVILAVPTFAVLRVIVIHVYAWIKKARSLQRA